MTLASSAYRTHTCGALKLADAGADVRLSGWIHRKRDHGGLMFIDLRDHYGLTQLVLSPETPGFALAERLGLDAQKFFDIASKSSGQCWSMTSYCPWPGPVPAAPSNRNYQGGFLTSLMLKDLKLAQDAAAKSGATTPLGAQAEALYALLDRLGAGGQDFSVMLQLLRGQLPSQGVGG